jgi:hypothetical protein
MGIGTQGRGKSCGKSWVSEWYGGTGWGVEIGTGGGEEVEELKKERAEGR